MALLAALKERIAQMHFTEAPASPRKDHKPSLPSPSHAVLSGAPTPLMAPTTPRNQEGRAQTTSRTARPPQTGPECIPIGLPEHRPSTVSAAQAVAAASPRQKLAKLAPRPPVAPLRLTLLERPAFPPSPPKTARTSSTEARAVTAASSARPKIEEHEASDRLAFSQPLSFRPQTVREASGAHRPQTVRESSGAQTQRNPSRVPFDSDPLLAPLRSVRDVRSREHRSVQCDTHSQREDSASECECGRRRQRKSRYLEPMVIRDRAPPTILPMHREFQRPLRLIMASEPEAHLKPYIDNIREIRRPSVNGPRPVKPAARVSTAEFKAQRASEKPHWASVYGVVRRRPDSQGHFARLAGSLSQSVNKLGKSHYSESFSLPGFDACWKDTSHRLQKLEFLKYIEDVIANKLEYEKAEKGIKPWKC